MRINMAHSFFAAALCGAALLTGRGVFAEPSTFTAATDSDNNGYNGTVKAGGDGYAFTADDSARYYKFLHLYDDLLLDGTVCAGSTNWHTAYIGTYAWHPVTVTVTNGARMVTARNKNILFKGKGGTIIVSEPTARDLDWKNPVGEKITTVIGDTYTNMIGTVGLGSKFTLCNDVTSDTGTNDILRLLANGTASYLFGKDQLELVPKIVEAAKKSGRLYMMNETTAFRPECVAMRALFEGGAIGKHVYTEGEYFHYWGQNGIPSYNGWRHGLPPQYYPTHSNGFYTCSTHGSFTEVMCIGITSDLPDFKDAKNPHKNPFGSEVALFKTSDGGAARMAVMWDAPGYHGETGRINGSKGSYGTYTSVYGGLEKELAAKLDTLKKPLPPGVSAGSHGGSHAYLTDDFLRGILVPGHKVCCGLKTALDTTLGGVYAHLSALKGGETLKIPQV